MHIARKTFGIAEQTIHDVNAGIELRVEAMDDGHVKLVLRSESLPGGERAYEFGDDGRLRELRSPSTTIRLRRAG